MKKIGNAVYIIMCLLLCVIPFAGMTVYSTNTTTENKKLAELPDIREQGSWNREYLQELGTYFEEHFAFRPQLVTADSVIQTKIFGVSNMDTVLAGKNGWLYYTATLDDYLFENTLSERGIQNVAHNISLIQQYVTAQGAAFVLTVAPNKNSLYRENMPYYAGKTVSDTKNMTRLAAELKECGISYADLFQAFEVEDEILYLKKDSHWNQKGAVLAYNTLLDYLEQEHENYETVDSLRTKTEYGDLNKMLYPCDFEPEWNYSYQKEPVYRYVTDTESVEDAWIVTKNETGEGSLLMFRDSFGNTLLPLMADTYQDAYFSKGLPYHLEEYCSLYHPQTVIVEKVERNIVDFAEEPPIVTGRAVELEDKAEKADTRTVLQMQESQYDTSYWEISGVVDEAYMKADTNIYIRMTANGETSTYVPFFTTVRDSDYGYLLYLPKAQLMADTLHIEVLTETDGKLQSVAEKDFDEWN
ncbi:MAG: hypothetical protein NC347_02945 [Clostridium sp.]|nr:hypothetical protein [Clostridium sp.]